MTYREDLEKKVFTAAREYGMSSVLLRNAVSRKLGLNVADMECLSLLNIRGIATPTELARYTGMTPGSATAMLDRLEQAELVQRRPNPHDRRGTLIEINKKSMAKIALMFAGAQKAQSELIANYSEKELEIIADYLMRFTNNVNYHAAAIEKELS